MSVLPGLDTVKDGEDVLGELFAVTLEDRRARPPLPLPLREDLLGPGRVGSYESGVRRLGVGRQGVRSSGERYRPVPGRGRPSIII